MHDLPWYNCWFGSDYLELYRHRSPEEAVRTIAWLTSVLNLRPAIRILDLACGNCRHSAELARRGYQTFGFDLSWPLLETAVIPDVSCRPVQRVRGDMRKLPFLPKTFDLVVSLFTSFGYFHDSREDQEVLAEIADVLVPGGSFVLDFLNARLVRKEIIPAETGRIGDREAIIERWVDEAAGRVLKRISIRQPNGAIHQHRESVRLYDVEEFQRMFIQNGIILKQIFGDYGGAGYTDRSPRLILVGVKSA